MKKGEHFDVIAYSKKYGKPDLERVGIFSELPYMNGTRYVSPFQRK